MSARELAILTRTSPLAPSPLAQSKLRPPSTPMSQFSERQRLALCHPSGYAHKICGRYRAKSRRRSALVVSADVPSLPPGAWTTVGLKLVLFLPRPQSWRLCCKLLLFSSHWSEGHAENTGSNLGRNTLVEFFPAKDAKKNEHPAGKKENKIDKHHLSHRVASRSSSSKPSSSTNVSLGNIGRARSSWSEPS